MVRLQLSLFRHVLDSEKRHDGLQFSSSLGRIDRGRQPERPIKPGQATAASDRPEQQQDQQFLPQTLRFRHVNLVLVTMRATLPAKSQHDIFLISVSGAQQLMPIASFLRDPLKARLAFGCSGAFVVVAIPITRMLPLRCSFCLLR